MNAKQIVAYVDSQYLKWLTTGNIDKYIHPAVRKKKLQGRGSWSPKKQKQKTKTPLKIRFLLIKFGTIS